MTVSRTDSRAETARERFLAAAVEAFAERGYHATTTRDIAAAAGMSPAALYVHHASKEEVLYAIARRGHETVLAAVSAAGSTSSDPAERLRAIMRAFVDFHVRSHTSARVINYELGSLSPEHHAEIRILRRQIEAVFHDAIDTGRALGMFVVPDSRMPVLALTSLGVDIARWYHDDGYTADQLALGYAEMALRIVEFDVSGTAPAGGHPAATTAPACGGPPRRP